MKKLLIAAVLMFSSVCVNAQDKKESVEKSPSISGLFNDISKEIRKQRGASESDLEFFLGMLLGCALLAFGPLMMWAFIYQCKGDEEAQERKYRDRKEWEKRLGQRGNDDDD